jgi:hypothetical protein
MRMTPELERALGIAMEDARIELMRRNPQLTSRVHGAIERIATQALSTQTALHCEQAVANGVVCDLVHTFRCCPVPTEAELIESSRAFAEKIENDAWSV